MARVSLDGAPKRQPLKIAIIGGGPGGLATAIALSQQNHKVPPGTNPPFDWTLYEKKPRISETGGGISLQLHTWRMLELLGVADNVDARDFFRSANGQAVEHRNAVTGVLVGRQFHPDDTPPHQVSCRMLRAKLQSALLKSVDRSRIQVNQKLAAVESVADSPRLRIVFSDGTRDDVDLLIGADGIRSVVRQILFPDHSIKYNGQSAYRTIISKSDVRSINGISWQPTFWQYVGGKYVYTCPLGNDDFEVTARIRQPPDGQEKVSWGRPYDFHQLLPQYDEFCPPLRAILKLSAKAGTTQEFALFSGPRLKTCIGDAAPKTSDGYAAQTATVASVNTALLGDASHPLSGAFGAGAGFAFEDAYTLARALSWALLSGRSLPEALEVYDRARSPHYSKLYDTLDRMTTVAGNINKKEPTVGQKVRDDNRRDWMYYYHADDVVEKVIKDAENSGQGREASVTGQAGDLDRGSAI